MKMLLLSELRPADVLLFSPEKKSFISWAITFLTDAPVSHAALYFNEAPPTIIEETPPQVSESSAQKRFHGRTIYVYRHTSTSPLNPVINAARRHLNNQEPYDHAGLYMVGLLLMYKKFSISSQKQQVIIRILKKLTATITHYIQQHQTPGKHPMVCSQFVAQCFDDAGSPFRLQFRNTSLRDSAFGETLLDKATSWMKQHQPVFSAYDTASAPETASDEALCEALHDAFLDNTNQPAPSMTEALAESIYQFAEAYAALINIDTAEKNYHPLTALQANNNMFVSPGDLMRAYNNLVPVGIVII
ncbi:hypothetical protein L2D25_24490 [Salmonella enterica subsp. enterica serovar Muenchen]|uniref:Uncharacterized protein n=1 Tax=Salmonella enterica subsp. enterica serovar Panama TaxID=29472 RepID=A0A619ALP0_SALET|nr:hypothetical protein [Salmonella enterica]EBG5306202.1 hypothetical protein [Salmonella enterica subsp. enterica serovar Oranienburg]EBU9820817.1 hypothetical protein [Salmonella enterica subsp. enterica serovar Newport]EBW1589803.1 hypothetical protein [Salmonella enterica subsp. diarizonae serovar 61:r:z]ECI3889543.1 hypothetical protein [Salmonella enterica subsp. enterica serovar Gombe]ECK2142932.1 hypothetical protein [Salmonella enterica subsp. enterica serovar Enteritidis]ECT5252283